MGDVERSVYFYKAELAPVSVLEAIVALDQILSVASARPA